MAKSHAERQREYRERKKAEQNSTWLNNETKRTKKYYTKISHLSETEAEKRRQALLKKQRRYLARKKQIAKRVNTSEESLPGQSTINAITEESDQLQDTEVSSTNQKLIVKLQPVSKQRKSNGKKNAKQIQYLQQVKKNLERNYQALLKTKLSRMRRLTVKPNASSPKTPTSTARKERDKKKADVCKLFGP